MANRLLPTFYLGTMPEGVEADLFLLLATKEEGTTRDGKPFIRVTFRDATGEITTPLWHDSAWFMPCKNDWKAGGFYKVRAILKKNNYGSQLDLRKVREVTEQDHQEGFDPLMCLPHSRFAAPQMFNDLVSLIEQHVESEGLRNLALAILRAHRESILKLPAATHHHHAFVGGFLEHVLSVARTAVYLADKYCAYYSAAQPPLFKCLVVTGAVLHDIGKLRELELKSSGGQYTPEGELIGHIVQGRDIVREFAAQCALDRETLLRLEHIVLSHQRTAEWGSPKPPMTPEALLVHYADDIDAKFFMVMAALGEERGASAMTSKKNAMQQKFFRGLAGE